MPVPYVPPTNNPPPAATEVPKPVVKAPVEPVVVRPATVEPIIPTSANVVLPASSQETLGAALSSIPGGLSAAESASIGAAFGGAPAEATQNFVASLGGISAEAAGSVLKSLGTLSATEATAVVAFTGSLPAEQSASLMGILGQGSATQVAAQVQALASVVSAISASDASQVFGAIAQFAQAGPGGSAANPISFASKPTTQVSATGQETATFNLEEEAPAASRSVADADVAGVTAASSSRTVVILVKPGQVGRIQRPKSGIWPTLLLPITSGKLVGLAPVIDLPAEATAISFDPSPTGLTAVHQGSLGGGNVIPLSAPFRLTIEDQARTGRTRVSLPSISVASG
ncbi:MAG: hypothetical protein EBT09_14900, partial [Actinobacteria bacterium]|nr:hypothetical protein [Actinomycetota bacterium]